MKTLKTIFIFLACSGLFIACSDSLIDPKMEQVELKKSSKSFISVFIIEPSGVDDTKIFIQAFEEAENNGKGTVIQLMEGDYYLNFIEIREFNGIFKGAGKELTYINPVEDLDVDKLIGQNLNTVLVRFVGGDITMSDLTFKTPLGGLSTGSETKINGLAGFSAATYNYTSEKEYIKATINNVGFYGHPENTFNGLKAEFGVRAGVTIPGGIPLSNIDISITNCSFEGFDWYGVLIMELNKGDIVVGTKNNGNYFDNNPYVSLGIWHNVNVQMSIVSNTFSNPSGTFFGIELHNSPYLELLVDEPQTVESFCTIEKNTFNITGGFGGLLVNDRRRYFYPNESPMLVQVKGNTFNMSNSAFTALGCVNTKGMVIRNNHFEGSGSFGVRILGPSPFPNNENGLLLGNNFSKTSYSSATVLLDEGTRNWSIVGGKLKENVIDLGIDNSITGMHVNTGKMPFGQTIVDNFEYRRKGM